MKKFRVQYTAYHNDLWQHRKGEMIVEANSKEEAKEIVKDKSDMCEEYFADYIEEIQ